MESDMVKQNSSIWADFNNIVINFVKEELPQFALKNETDYGPYWGASFVNNNGIEFRVRGESNGLDIVIIIDEEEIPLWKYDRKVLNAPDSTKENILYQLEIIKRFLSESPQ